MNNSTENIFEWTRVDIVYWLKQEAMVYDWFENSKKDNILDAADKIAKWELDKYKIWNSVYKVKK